MHTLSQAYILLLNANFLCTETQIAEANAHTETHTLNTEAL